MPALAHFGIGFATKRIAPKIPLWALLVSAMVPDIISIFFILVPGFTWFHHGLIMNIIWALLAMVTTIIVSTFLNSRKDQNNKVNFFKLVYPTAIIVGLLVFSHWILDFIGWPMSAIDPTAKGIPVFFDSSYLIGLGVYSTLIGALTMDIGVFVVGLLIYIYTLKKLGTDKAELNE